MKKKIKKNGTHTRSVYNSLSRITLMTKTKNKKNCGYRNVSEMCLWLVYKGLKCKHKLDMT